MSRYRQFAVSDLEIGMYVSELDRPWLETPFLFQGFVIRSDEELEALRRHCRVVTVDTHVEDDEPAAAPVAGGRQRRPAEAVRELKADMEQASGIHMAVFESIESAMGTLRSSGKLDLRRLEAAVEPMVASVLRNPTAMSCLMRIRRKGGYLYSHSLASSVWAAVLGREIGLDRDALRAVALGGMLLDVGKTRLPETILAKPGKLDAAELAQVRRHVEYGLDLLKEAGELDPRVVEMVAHHHERYNGSGYPAGLRGAAIPVYGRIAGIVDTYDAMITSRPYASTQSSYGALRQLRALANIEFQSELVDQFTQAIGLFPTGTLVLLNTGEVAVVTAQSRIRRLRPEIMIILDADKRPLAEFRVVDLNQISPTADDPSSLWIESGLEPGAFGVDPAAYYLN
ncbi:MAG: HD-GYP domain-containing protein [Steroidobacteraceae bacterium]|nr:HD-GYP domain-containing protein [Steroidobacteraceae bacterium]